MAMADSSDAPQRDLGERAVVAEPAVGEGVGGVVRQLPDRRPSASPLPTGAAGAVVVGAAAVDDGARRRRRGRGTWQGGRWLLDGCRLDGCRLERWRRLRGRRAPRRRGRRRRSAACARCTVGWQVVSVSRATVGSVVATTSDADGGDDLAARHPVDEAALHRRHDDLVAGLDARRGRRTAAPYVVRCPAIAELPSCPGIGVSG